MKKSKKIKKTMKKRASKKKPQKRKQPKKKILRKRMKKSRSRVRAGGKEKAPVAEKSLPPSDAALKNLMEKAHMRGFVTENELLFVFPEVEDYLKVYDKFLDEIVCRGSKIIASCGNRLGRKKEQGETLKRLGIA
ncbi:MAG: hypothetical protein AAB731_03400 [Patescibacteria group bacterium]